LQKKEEETTKPETKINTIAKFSSNNSNSTEITNATATSGKFMLLQGNGKITADAKRANRI
jgi:hypothetical protein